MSERLTPWYFPRDSALARLDDDEELLQDVIEQFVADAPEALAAIEQAIERGDSIALRHAAHSLKGAAGYLAADELCALAQTLEGFGYSNQLAQARLTWPALSALAEDVVDALSREIAPPPTAA
jgi:two-component system sensor histidine kinase/response regulator